jgi:hypothetical protein
MAEPDRGDMTSNLDRAHRSHHREAATPAAGSTAQSAAAGPAKPSSTRSTTPTDEKAAIMPPRWPLMIFVVMLTALFLAACITAFFSVGLPLLTQIIEWFQANVIRVF